MTGLQKLYVDFTIRDPEGHFYVARLEQFSPAPVLGLIFRGTDFDEFEVDCEVIAIDYEAGRVLHRPVDASAVPGTALRRETKAPAPNGIEPTSERGVDSGLQPGDAVQEPIFQ